MSQQALETLLAAPTEARPSWLAQRAASARTFAQSQGLPTQRLERWRYTPVAATLGANTWTTATDAATVDLPEGVLPVDGIAVVAVDGVLSVQMSGLGSLPKGVRISSLTDAILNEEEGLADLMTIGDSFENHSLRAANDAVNASGLVIHVEKNQAISTPIHLIYITTKTEAAVLAQPRLLVDVATGAEVTIIESHVSTDPDAVAFKNMLTQFRVGDNAHVKHIKWQDEARTSSHVATIDVHVHAHATYKAFVGQSGAKLARHDTRIAVMGSGAHAEVNGVYLADNGQHHDITSVIDHRVPQATSHQVVRGVVQTGARGVFLGKAVVAQDAQQTDARQMHKALMLDNTAEIDAKPELEIYADDVQCAHGNTIGDIDEMALFYMEARGISRPVARRMLIEGFMAEVVEVGVPAAYQEAITQKVLESIK